MRCRLASMARAGVKGLPGMRKLAGGAGARGSRASQATAPSHSAPKAATAHTGAPNRNDRLTPAHVHVPEVPGFQVFPQRKP